MALQCGTRRETPGRACCDTGRTVTPPPPTVTLGLDVDASPDAVWDLLVTVSQWPRWGPSVRRAVLDGGEDRLSAGATGRVWTTPGPSVSFRVDDWTVEDTVRHWSWHVAGIPATGHTVLPRVGGCRVEMSVPWWATAYTPVLWWGLRHIRDAAETTG